MLQSRFIPVAIDQAFQRRQKDSEGEFYRKIASQGPRSDFNGTTQGFYIATSSGDLLLYNNNRHPEKVRRLMREKLDEFFEHRDANANVAPLSEESRDRLYNVKPPEGGAILRVHGKVLDGYEPTDDRWQEIFQSALSRDNMWLTAEEHKQVAAGNIPKQVQQRLVRFHLVDGTRGEPPMWNEDEIRTLDMQLDNGRLSGKVHLETKDGKRGYQAQILGYVESSGETLTRFDVVVHGDFWGEGRYTKNAPEGKFPLAISFSLADGKDIADEVVPQAWKGWHHNYLK